MSFSSAISKSLTAVCGLSLPLIRYKASECSQEAEFDVYLEKTKRTDLKKLVHEFESGKNVWPWVWTKRNENGPHYVFVGSNKDIDEN